jgi:CarD family transcriptional regulator
LTPETERWYAREGMAQTARSTRSSSLDRAPAKAKKAPRKPAPAKAKPSPLKPLKGGAAKAKTPALRSLKGGAAATSAKPKTPTLTPLKGGAAAARVAAPAPAKSAPAKSPPPAREEDKRASTVVARGYVPLVDIPKLPPPPQFDLAVGDKAVHPSHGLGEVIAIEHRELGGAKGEFYILRMNDNGREMRVMVPRSAAVSVGLRPVMSAKEADRVLDTMRAREVAVDLQPWSRRFRAYTEMIKSGWPQEVAKVLRDMYRLKFDKDLSFGERRLLDQAKSLLMKELAAAKSVTLAELQAEVDEMFRA